MIKREQVRPLALATDRHHNSSDDEEKFLKKITCQRKYIRWCSCFAAVMIFLILVVVILISTVFKMKEPKIKMNGVNLNNGFTPKPGTNLSLTADISVKNQNFASFRYKNTTMCLYYDGVMIGEARGPPGQSEARETTRMNVTIKIMVDSLLGIPRLASDLGRGIFTMSGYTRVVGRVKFLIFTKEHVTVRMNCTLKVNIASRTFEDQKCKMKFDL